MAPPRVYGDPEELLRNETLDFVDIITEVPAHEPLVLLAAQYGVPVICQKPMSSDYASCQRMVQACEDAGIPFYVHENYRWQAPIRELKRIVDDGAIGRPFRGRFQFLHALEPFVWENQPLLKALPKLIIADQGSHQLDLARFFFGEFRQIHAQHLRVRDDIAAEDVASISLRNDDAIVNVELSFVSHTEWNHFPEVAHLPGRDRRHLGVGRRLLGPAHHRCGHADSPLSRRPATPGPTPPTTSTTPAWCPSTRTSCAACAAVRRRKTQARTTSRPCSSSTPPTSRRSGMPSRLLRDQS